MSNYRRILALVEPGKHAEAVARRAYQLARLHGAAFAIAAVADYTPGEECEDCIPVITPAAMRSAIEQDVGGKLQVLADRIGAAGAEVISATGSYRNVAADLFGSWKPDLLVLDSRVQRSLDKIETRGPFDVLAIHPERPSFGGRLVQAIASAF
jgi:Universal stress protein family